MWPDVVVNSEFLNIVRSLAAMFSIATHPIWEQASQPSHLVCSVQMKMTSHSSTSF